MFRWMLNPSMLMTYLVAIGVFVATVLALHWKRQRFPWVVGALFGVVAGTAVGFLLHEGGGPRDLAWYLGGFVAGAVGFGVPLGSGAIVGSLLKRKAYGLRMLFATLVAAAVTPVSPFLALVAVCVTTGNCL